MEGGTGVYYQAMPAVGPDGRNVMKLIPVQKVNGQFFQTVFNTEKDNVELQVKVCSNPVLSSLASSSPSLARLPSLKTRLPSLQPTADGRYILKAPQQVSTFFNTPKVQHVGNINLPRPSKQVHVPSAKPTISHNFPPQTNGQPMAVVQKLPVTVKSPVLPNGHCLQIPSYAQVRTVPASALPPSIKSQIMNSVSITPANEKQQTVVMVSPVNSVKLNSDQQAFTLTKQSQTQKTISPHLPAHTGTSSPVCSPIYSKASEKVSAPIKWVVQEESGTPGPCLVPASSTQLNAIATKSVKHVESVTLANNIVSSKSTQSQISPEQITPGKDNALVMCNGKVYFVAKKNSEIAKDVMVSEGGRKGFHSISPALPASSALGSNASKVTKKLDPEIKASEIIDLCDDEEESSTSLGGSPGNLPTQNQTEADDSSEDSNVIFVSYIPPKSENLAGDMDTNCASQNKIDDIACEETEINVVLQNDREEAEHTEMEIDVGQENTAAEENDAQMEEQVEESRPAETNLSSCENVGMEGEKQLEKEISPVSILADITSADGAALCDNTNEREDVSEQVHNVCVPTTDNTEETFENSAPGRTTQHKSDCQLKKEFGVTSDVRISLQKIRWSESSNPQERLIINKRTLDGLRKVIQESQLQSKVQKMMQVPRKNTEDNEYLKGVKRNKLEQDVKDEHQENSSLSTTNISPVSVFPMENSLLSQTCQDFCSSSRNTGETVVSTASKVHIQSETVYLKIKQSKDCSADTHCLTSSSEKTQTNSPTASPPSALRKTAVRLKKGKVCMACPCGAVLGATETTSSLQPQGTESVAFESHKETRKSCVHKTQKEGCHSTGDHSFVKKVGKKKKNSPRKKKSLSKSSCGNSRSIISPDCSVSITKLLNDSSSNLQEGNKEIALFSNESESSILSHIHTQTETSEQDTSQMEVAVNDTSVQSSSKQQDSSLDELPTQDLYSMEVLDAEEIKRQERIKRLKNLLRQKEAALERMRHSMNI